MKAKKNGMIFMGIGVMALFTAAIMLLWNALIPSIFGLTAINFWQALGLFVLSRMLFGGFGPFRRAKMMMGGKMGGHHHHPIHDKWQKMTPEQRKAFIMKRRAYMGKHAHGPFGFGGGR